MLKTKTTTILYFLIVLGLILLVKLSVSTYGLWKADERLKQAIIEKNQQVVKKEELTKTLSEISTNDYVEKMAREKLGMGRQGETVVILPQIDYKKIQEETRKLENWEKWVRMIFY